MMKFGRFFRVHYLTIGRAKARESRPRRFWNAEISGGCSTTISWPTGFFNKNIFIFELNGFKSMKKSGRRALDLLSSTLLICCIVNPLSSSSHLMSVHKYMWMGDGVWSLKAFSLFSWNSVCEPLWCRLYVKVISAKYHD